MKDMHQEHKRDLKRESKSRNEDKTSQTLPRLTSCFHLLETQTPSTCSSLSPKTFLLFVSRLFHEKRDSIPILHVSLAEEFWKKREEKELHSLTKFCQRRPERRSLVSKDPILTTFTLKIFFFFLQQHKKSQVEELNKQVHGRD